mmetsp:Transcript_10684/g.22502  ORF Transcript_10684/g.22502 Transcript_10684/m.22502 type:complete len:322 (+) Transcript_10684:917-1882(+)
MSASLMDDCVPSTTPAGAHEGESPSVALPSGVSSTTPSSPTPSKEKAKGNAFSKVFADRGGVTTDDWCGRLLHAIASTGTVVLLLSGPWHGSSGMPLASSKDEAPRAMLGSSDSMGKERGVGMPKGNDRGVRGTERGVNAPRGNARGVGNKPRGVGCGAKDCSRMKDPSPSRRGVPLGNSATGEHCNVSRMLPLPGVRQSCDGEQPLTNTFNPQETTVSAALSSLVGVQMLKANFVGNGPRERRPCEVRSPEAPSGIVLFVRSEVEADVALPPRPAEVLGVPLAQFGESCARHRFAAGVAAKISANALTRDPRTGLSGISL